MPPSTELVSLSTALIDGALKSFRSNKGWADKAIEQLSDDKLHIALDSNTNCIAVIMKHVAGNLLSRWTDFLTTDGEKPWRNRDDEFVDSLSALVSKAGVVFRVDLISGKARPVPSFKSTPSDAERVLAVTRDGLLSAVLCNDRTNIRLVDFGSGLDWKPNRGQMFGWDTWPWASFSPDSHLVLVRKQGEVRLCRLPTAERRFPLKRSTLDDAGRSEDVTGEMASFQYPYYAPSHQAHPRILGFSEHQFAVTGNNHAYGTCINIFDIRSQRLLRRLDTGLIQKAISHDGRYLAAYYPSSKPTPTVHMLDLETGDTVWSKPSGDGWAQFSQDGKLCFIGDGPKGAIVVYATRNGTKAAVLRGTSQKRMVSTAISSDGLWMAATYPGQKTGIVNLFPLQAIDPDAKTDQSVLIAPTTFFEAHFKPHSESQVTACTFSTDSTQFFTAGSDRTIRVWDRKSGEQHSEIKELSSPAVSLAQLPDGRLLTGHNDGVLHLWDLKTGKESFALHGGSQPQYVQIADGGRIAIADSPKEYKVRLWRLPPPNKSREELDYSGEVHREKWNAGPKPRNIELQPTGEGYFGTKLVKATENAETESVELNLMDAESGKPIRKYEGNIGKIAKLAISRDGKRLAALDSKGICVWDVSSGRLLNRLDDHGHDLSFSTDGRLLLVSRVDIDEKNKSSSTIQLTVWNVEAGDMESRKKRTIPHPNHRNQHSYWRLLPGESRLLFRTAAPWAPGPSAIFDRESVTELFRLEGIGDGYPTAAVVLPDSKQILLGDCGGGMALFSTVTGQHIRKFVGHGSDGSYHEGVQGIIHVVLTADGKFALTAAGDKTIRLWELATGKQLHVFWSHNSEVTRVAFHKDGQHVVSASLDGTVRKWRLPNAVAEAIRPNE